MLLPRQGVWKETLTIIHPARPSTDTTGRAEFAAAQRPNRPSGQADVQYRMPRSELTGGAASMASGAFVSAHIARVTMAPSCKP
jgi:hypothetical protein